MNKKALFVIVLAGILALLGAYLILRPKKVEIQPIPVEPVVTTPVSEPASTELPEAEPEQKPEVIQPVKKVSYKKPVIQPAKVEEPVIKPIVVREAQDELVPDAGIIREEDSKDVVITREFKMQSPSRYTFK